jgi:outer membrane receptor protein involved in Fe transport
LKRLWLNAGSTFLYSYVFKAASGDYSFSDNKRVPNVPVLTFDAGIEYGGTKDTVSLSGQYMSERFTNTENTESVDGYFVLNFFYKRKLSETFSLSVAVDNLLNADYEVMKGHIMPPLFILAGVEAVF